MSINIWTDSMQHAALLGKPVLFTNWLIQRDIIPDGWYCYDLRGTHKSPSTRTTLVDHAADYHAGTVLSPIPLKHEGTASRRVNGTFYLLGEEMTLEQFCEEHDLAYPQDNREFVLRPASLDEVGLFYSEEKLDEALGTVGHLRMDFGHGEKEFWHTWWPHNEDRFNTPEFKEVLQRFVDDLRQTGLLKNLGAMDAYCWQHGGSITEDRRSYGYIAETENYRFCLRCTPFPGEYQGYLYLDAFISQVREAYGKLELFGPEHCEPNSYESLDYEGRVLVLSPDTLKESCWTPQNQLWLAHDGFGCSPHAVGRSIRCTCLGDGEQTRWNRTDFTGVLKEEFLPGWAREKLEEFQGQNAGMGGMEMT